MLLPNVHAQGYPDQIVTRRRPFKSPAESDQGNGPALIHVILGERIESLPQVS